MHSVNPYTNVNAPSGSSLDFSPSKPTNGVQAAAVSAPVNPGLGYDALNANGTFSNAVKAAAGETPALKPESPPEASAADPDLNPETADAVEAASLEAAGAGEKSDPAKPNEKGEAKAGVKIEANGEGKPAVAGKPQTDFEKAVALHQQLIGMVKSLLKPDGTLDPAKLTPQIKKKLAGLAKELGQLKGKEGLSNADNNTIDAAVATAGMLTANNSKAYGTALRQYHQAHRTGMQIAAQIMRQQHKRQIT